MDGIVRGLDDGRQLRDGILGAAAARRFSASRNSRSTAEVSRLGFCFRT